MSETLTTLPANTLEIAEQDEMTRLLIENNIERLGEVGEVGRSLIPVYKAALKESPHLSEATVITAKPGDRSLARLSPGSAKRVEFDDFVIIATNSWRPYGRLIKHRPTLVEIVATRLDVEASDVDKVTAAAFTFAHELGHVDDWARQRAGERPQTVRSEELQTLPVPGKDPTDLLTLFRTIPGLRYWHQHKDAFAEQGIHSKDDLIAAQERAYRAMPSEFAADDFAARVLKGMRQAQV